jgi:hypothetical protein
VLALAREGERLGLHSAMAVLKAVVQAGQLLESRAHRLRREK